MSNVVLENRHITSVVISIDVLCIHYIGCYYKRCNMVAIILVVITTNVIPTTILHRLLIQLM